MNNIPVLLQTLLNINEFGTIHYNAQKSLKKEVIVDKNDSVTYTDVSLGAGVFPQPQNFILKSDNYPDVIFYANYFNDSTDSIIYRFSSGIILDSSDESSHYKIVLASYNVNKNKVTFVEKVLL